MLSVFKKTHKGRKTIPLRFYLAVYILILIIPILILLSVIDYLNSLQDLSSSEALLRVQAENEIVNTIRIVDSAYKMFEKTLEDDMRQAFKPFLEAYKKAGGNPSKIDLESLKEQLGGKMDLYIINKDAEVIYSTYETDIGLQFGQFPEFVKYLETIRKGNSFSADRISPEVRTGILRKYAYMPTPDHQYILELGLVSDEFKNIIDELNYVKIGTRLLDVNPSLSSVKIFDRAGNLIGNPEFEPGRKTLQRVRIVYSRREDMEFVDKDTGTVVKYLFIDLADPNYATDVSKIVELVYNNLLMQHKLKSKTVYHISISLLTILLAIILTPIVAGKMTRPIKAIVHDVDKIAKGDLEHRVKTRTKTELTTIERSINSMVKTLQEKIESEKKTEEKLRAYSKHLDDLVKARTRELRETNEDLKAFVHSVSHDLRAPLQAMTDLAESLLTEYGDRLNENGREYARRIERNARYIETLIQDLLNYNYISRTEIELEPVDLEHAIDEVIAQIQPEIEEKEAEVHVKGTFPKVMAHSATLFTVIMNLVTNALKYVEPGTKPVIQIYGEKRERWFRLWVEDNGIGILPEDQERIFEIFERVADSEEYKGTGVGLAMVYKGIERMGGQVGVESASGKGSKFWIELRRA